MIEETSSPAEHHRIVLVKNMAPHVAVVQFDIILGLRLAGTDLRFEVQIFACFTCGGYECPAAYRVTLTLSNERLDGVSNKSRERECRLHRLTLHSRDCRRSNEGAARRWIRVMANSTLCRYLPAWSRRPYSMPPMSLSDNTVLMNLNIAELTHIE